MSTPNEKYWAERFEQLTKALMNMGEGYAEKLDTEYRKAFARIQKEIELFYQRFAENNQISLSEARRLLTSKELEEFKWTVEEYIKYGEQNALDGAWMKQLENASLRYRISRLESLQIQMRQQIEALAASRESGMKSLLSDMYSESYYRSIYEVQKGFGVGSTFAQLDNKTIDNVLSSPWTADGGTFSSKIWGDRTTLVNQVQNKLSQAFVRGDPPDKAIKNVAERFNVARNAAGRMVMTESAFFANEGRSAAYAELDVERYQYLATIETNTCETCGDLDGMVFKLSEKLTGVNYPVMHPWCRCTTVPYFEDNYTERFARDIDGKAYKVPGDTTYKQWREQLDTKYGKENVDKAAAIKRDVLEDKKQYQEYKDLLGAENIPKSFSEFQEIKYNKSAEWGVLKAQKRGMSYYQKAVEAEPEITDMVTGTADRIGMRTAGLEYRVKGKDSYLRKIRTNYKPGGNEYEIKDILRYTYTAGPDKLVEKTLRSIDEFEASGYNTIEIKNFWLKKDNPYQGINTVIKAPNGQKFELQYHTPESFELKNGKLHEIYEKQRLIEDETSEEFIRFRDEMYDLSDDLTVPDGIERINAHDVL